MALGSGLAAQLGVAAETTYGTGVTVTRFFPLIDESLKSDPERVESKGIIAGARVIKSNQWQTGFITVGGDVGLELSGQGLGVMFTQMFGSVTSSATGGVATHTFSPGDLTGKSFTAQVGRPQVGGVVTPFTYAGCKVASWEIAHKADEISTLGLTVIAKSETTGTALASATYLTGQEKGLLPPSAVAALSISGTSVCIRELTLAGDNGLAANRMCVGSNTVDEPLESGIRKYTGKVTMEFSNTSVYSQFVLGGEYPISISMGSSLSLGYVNFTLNARFDSGVPEVGGPELLIVDREFTCVATSMTNDATAITAVLINSQTST